jgi:hypothetical protein
MQTIPQNSPILLVSPQAPRAKRLKNQEVLVFMQFQLACLGNGFEEIQKTVIRGCFGCFDAEYVALVFVLEVVYAQFWGFGQVFLAESLDGSM